MEVRKAGPAGYVGGLLGRRVEWHHPAPKGRGGRGKVPVHSTCHRVIHVHFTNAELAHLPFDGGSEALRERDAMSRFLGWVVDKPPDFHAPTFRPGGGAMGGRGRR